VETKEVLRQWVGGAGCKRISARLGLDVKTLRRYLHAAQAVGLIPTSGEAALTDEWLTTLLASMGTQAGRPRGDAWERCQAHRDRIKQLLAQAAIVEVAQAPAASRHPGPLCDPTSVHRR